MEVWVHEFFLWQAAMFKMLAFILSFLFVLKTVGLTKCTTFKTYLFLSFLSIPLIQKILFVKWETFNGSRFKLVWNNDFYNEFLLDYFKKEMER